MSERQTTRLAAWGSGGGTTFLALARQLHEGVIGGFAFGLVITDKPEAAILEKVAYANRQWGMDIRTEVIDRKRYPGGKEGRGITTQQSEQAVQVLADNKIDNLILLGCMAILRGPLMEQYGWRPEFAAADHDSHGVYHARIQNTHPGLLPETADTYGVYASRKIYERGVLQTAHTFHAVGADIDGGPLIAEHRIAVPRYDVSTPERLDAAAGYLFTLVQAVEKAHLSLDMERYYAEQQAYLARAA